MIILVFDLDDTLLMSNEYNGYETIKFNNELLNLLNSLNYKKIIYTNGTYGHAKNSIPKLLGRDIFNETYARDTIPYMKPLFQSFNHVKNSIFYNLNEHEYDDVQFIFFDDNLDNMKTAKNIDWVSVWIPHRNYNNNIRNKNYPFVDYKYNNIYEALKDMNTIITDLNKPKFIQSNNFLGQKKGYHFKKGNNGLGYYLEKNIK